MLTLFHSCYYAVVLFRSREHENCGPQPGYVRAHIESRFIIFSVVPSIQCWEQFGMFISSLWSRQLYSLIFSGGGFNISPLKPRNGRPRTQVQHLMQIDLKGWGVGYMSWFQQHCLLQMLNSVAGDVLSMFFYFLCKVFYTASSLVSLLLVIISCPFLCPHTSWFSLIFSALFYS